MESTAMPPCFPKDLPAMPPLPKGKSNPWVFVALSVCLFCRAAARAGEGSAAETGAAGGTRAAPAEAGAKEV